MLQDLMVVGQRVIGVDVVKATRFAAYYQGGKAFHGKNKH
jgi:hypothetical protein